MLVTTFVELTGQFVTVGGHWIIVITAVVYTVDVVLAGIGGSGGGGGGRVVGVVVADTGHTVV